MSIRRVCGVAVGGGYLIRTFVAASRAEIKPSTSLRKSLHTPARWQPPRLHVRCYATKGDIDLLDTPWPQSESSEQASVMPDGSEGSFVTDAGDISHATPLAIDSGSSEPSSNTNSLPWYLQVNAPATPSTTNPFAERQRLPALPPHPPPVLESLLSHVSVELGMDDLSLLDLRGLDPPAALGANLIMIIGTARSEKHLHVSADRLCRWLRTEHALRPFADGLIGRNELKLRMKRKAKRSRLLSSVGAKPTAAGQADDGIRTGWVCVNVGQVEGGVLPAEEGATTEQDYVGFRTEEIGCRIVVQMMTDDKRGALDLESLWTGIMNRSMGRGKDAVEKEVDTTPVQVEVVKDTRAPSQPPSRPKDGFDNPFPEAQIITA